MLIPVNFTFCPTNKNSMSSSTYTSDEELRTPRPSPERNVAARHVHGYGMTPYEGSIAIPVATEVDLNEMCQESPERKCVIMYLQLIRIVSGSEVGQHNGSTYNSYYNKKNKKEVTGSQYYRLLLFRDLMSPDGKVVYMIDGKHMNEKMWTRYPLLRDNGTVTIGTYVGLMNPRPINQWFCNVIPIIESRGSCFVMKPPGCVASINIDVSVTKNTTRAFVLNNVDVEVTSMDVITTKCSGLFCDRQRAVDIGRGNRACGCFVMPDRVGNIILAHHVIVKKEHMVKVEMDDFSSLKFSSVYMKKPFSSTMRFNLLDYTPAYFTLQKAADDVLNYINVNGGFTVIGWYKRGEINDISNEENQNDVESGDIGYHIVSIYPTNRNLVERLEVKKLQFDMPGNVI